MNKAGLKEALGALGPSAGVRFGEPMASHTALGIGGLAEVFAVPESEDVLVRVLKAAMDCGAPVVALGGGTNLLVRDAGVSGLVVHVGALKSLEAVGSEGGCGRDEVMVRAGAGVRLQQLLAFCRREGLSGIEALAGIPGMLGGAVAGNAGSYGTEIKDVVQTIRLVGFDGTVRELGVEDAGFVYRGSSLVETGVVTEVTLCLRCDDPAKVADRMDEFLARKQSAQPVGERSAGCVFRNPEGESAGKLIDTAGCKSMGEMGIEVSRLHANFFINRDRGSAGSFLKLMDAVAQKVQEVHGIRLDTEIRVIGK